MAAKQKKQNKSNGGGQMQSTDEGNGSNEQTQEQAVQTTEGGEQKAGQIIAPIKKLAFSQLNNQKEHVVNRIYSVTTAIRQFDDQLREQNQDEIAKYGDTAARQLERLSGYLQNQDAGTLVQEVGKFAKRNPLIIVGGALALGLVGGRLLKSSGGQSAAGNA